MSRVAREGQGEGSGLVCFSFSGAIVGVLVRLGVALGEVERVPVLGEGLGPPPRRRSNLRIVLGARMHHGACPVSFRGLEPR